MIPIIIPSPPRPRCRHCGAAIESEPLPTWLGIFFLLALLFAASLILPELYRSAKACWLKQDWYNGAPCLWRWW